MKTRRPCDPVLDRELGPLILEVDVRPGLYSRITYRAGLSPRLEKIETDGKHLGDINKRIAIAKEHFGVADSTR